MPKSDGLIQSMERYGAHNYLPLPVVLKKGKGAKVWDVDGKEYLDFLACYSALNFGHQHPRLLAALQAQAAELSVCSRAFYSEPLCHFVEELAAFCKMDSVLAMNTGTEAVETALKLARKWGQEIKGVPEKRAKILAFKNNFHGRTISIVSFSSEALYKRGFGPFTPGFELVEFGDLKDLEAKMDDDVVAVLAEPIQAEAGIFIPPKGYLKSLSDLCKKKNVLLALDEIQTGMGRTGNDFCFQGEGLTPDLLILGKSLGGGLLPLSAVLARREVMDVITPGTHGSTFGGNPLATAVGRESLKVLSEEKLSERSRRLGEKAVARLRDAKLPLVKEVRGQGLLIGIEVTPSAGGARRFCERLAGLGVLCKETHEVVIRVAPPLVIEEADLMTGIDRICEAIQQG